MLYKTKCIPAYNYAILDIMDLKFENTGYIISFKTKTEKFSHVFKNCRILKF